MYIDHVIRSGDAGNSDMWMHPSVEKYVHFCLNEFRLITA